MMFRFAVSVGVLFPLSVAAADFHVPDSVFKSMTDSSVHLHKQRWGGADYHHEIKRFSFTKVLSPSVSVAANIVSSQRGLQDCANSYDQRTLGYEILPRLKVRDNLQVSLGVGRLDGGHMAFVTGDKLDMVDRRSVILAASIPFSQPSEALELRVSRSHYDAHAVYDQQTGFYDNSLRISYQLRF
ncbi:hypothetical protein [Lacimicrobium sp. SS2-24]|uniref:hypothetical protein n=1 Tax=Lacimicrobium sp. SS2-24 TaxID=2005569 RepID=UPI0011308E55|nr:hypothetical protein [Lacimicrobium sp. SS2-24]